jgi:hypothetical protein
MSGAGYIVGAGTLLALVLLYMLLRTSKKQGAAEASLDIVKGLDAETIKRTQEAAKEVARETSPEDTERALKNGVF